MSNLVNIDGGSIVREAMAGLDALFTSDAERAAAKLAAARLAQHPHILQALTNLEEAKHPSIFVAGWRPFLGWLAGFCLAYAWILRDLLIIALAAAGKGDMIAKLPELGTSELLTLVGALLGLGGIRMWEGLKGAKRDNLKAAPRPVAPPADTSIGEWLEGFGVAVKPGVRLDGLDLEAVGPIIHAARAAYSAEGADIVITSAMRPNDAKSFHSKGRALDFRTRHLSKAAQSRVADGIQARLGAAYDVVLESDHIHVEADGR